MLLFFIKLLLLFLSLSGYILYVHKQNIHICFSPIIALACISLIMFFAGLLNIMSLMVLILFLGGFALLYHALRNLAFRLQRDHFLVGSFFLICYFFFAFRLKDTQVSWYDNFSHWAMVVRDMLKTDHLPNFSSYLIDFQNYPTGISGFLYYICKILGNSEGSMLFGQFLVILSCLCTLFAFVKRHKIFSTAVILAASCYLLEICVPITELLVDTLLSLLAIASFACIVYYQDDRPKAQVCTSILMTFLILIKTNGIFFVLTHGLLLTLIEFRASKLEKPAQRLPRIAFTVLLSIVVPLFAYYLWKCHVSVSFFGGGTSKHGLNMTSIIGILRGNIPSEFLQIFAKFSQRIIRFEGEFTAIAAFPFVYLACTLYKTKIQKQPVSDTLFFCIWCIFSHVCYLIGMLGLYLFAMPYDEAVELASFGRYILTITSYSIGVTFLFLLREMDSDCEKYHCIKIIAASLACFLLFATPIRISSIFQRNYLSPEKKLLIHAKTEYSIPDESKCYIIGEGNYSLLYYMARYELWTGNLVYGDTPPEIPTTNLSIPMII